MTHLEKLYRQVAAEMELPVPEVERMCRYQFLFLVEQAAALNQVRLPALCAFQVMDWAVAKREKELQERVNRKFQKFGFHAY